MWGASVAAIAVSSRKLKKDLDSAKVPLMGALGAFVFAAQMINFSIPGTGSSGHLGGAMLLAILLGPHAAFLVLVSILTVQALFFADGGILALGANIFNMGFYACFLAYPLLYRPLVGDGTGRIRAFAAAVIASIAGMAAGAFSVVIQTVTSGVSSLPLVPFASVMVPIHLAIGAVEGIVTGFVVVIIRRLEPGILTNRTKFSRANRRRVLIGVLGTAIVLGGLISWFASSNPDGLEWSVARIAGEAESETGRGGLFSASAWLQQKLAFLPNYGFHNRDAGNPATTVSGIVGGIITLSAVILAGMLLRRRTRRDSPAKGRHAGD
jgi:cobalt/nickel transport system permease protein